jgi:CRP-like cAMP-binding protein
VRVRFALLASVPEEDLRRVLALARRRTFRKGEVVFHRGDPADALHLVSKGRFAARITTLRGDSLTFRIMHAGEAFGELALASENHVRSATVEALEPGETLSIGRAEFGDLLARYPAVHTVLTSLLAEDVRRTSNRLLEALTVDAERRVLRRLVELADSYAAGEDDPVIVLTQEELAGLAGTSRETVNRVLREEARDGAVELRRGRIALRDLPRLRRRAFPHGDV